MSGLPTIRPETLGTECEIICVNNHQFSIQSMLTNRPSGPINWIRINTPLRARNGKIGDAAERSAVRIQEPPFPRLRVMHVVEAATGSLRSTVVYGFQRLE